ncbi:MAG: sugar isomerase, partial [Herbinix sp.]|nr:sugar isomerase [Herbinix sp.]
MTLKKKTMLDYVAESPAAMIANIKRGKELTSLLVKEYVEGNYKNIWIIASGSSGNGSNCARQFMRKHLSCEVKVLSPFTFQYAENDFTENDMVVVVSQSGY